MKLNKVAHIHALDTAIEELQDFGARTLDPAPIPHQYVGTVIDNTICLIGAPANALDGKGRQCSFTQEENWISLMQAVHRSFFSSLLIAVESGLKYICEKNDLGVKSPRDKLKEKILRISIRTETSVSKLLQACARQLSSKPLFNDYLREVLRNKKFPSRKDWIKFFDALTIIRNKSSHSNVSLTESEKSRLKSAGLGGWISKTGDLHVNPRRYKFICEKTLNFFDEAMNFYK